MTDAAIASLTMSVTTAIGIGYQIWRQVRADRLADKQRQWDKEDRELARETAAKASVEQTQKLSSEIHEAKEAAAAAYDVGNHGVAKLGQVNTHLENLIHATGNSARDRRATDNATERIADATEDLARIAAGLPATATGEK